MQTTKKLGRLVQSHGYPIERITILDVLAFYVLYFVSFEVISGRTPGKVLTGTRVVTNDGRARSIPTALIRSLCRMIPFEPMSFSLGETWWHDSLSRTQVVRLRRAS